MTLLSPSVQSQIYPLRDASVNLSSPNGDVLYFTYTPVQKSGVQYEMYYTYNGVLKYATSLTGTNWTSITNVTAPMNESIIKKGNVWYMGYHNTYNDTVRFFTTQSTNGINFPAGVPRFTSGEDMSFMINNDSFYCYIRPKAPREDPIRKIGLMKSKDFINWTPIQTILAIDSADYNNVNSPDYRKQFYNMSVFKNGNDWWGLVNVLRLGDQGQDTEQLPPYNALEQTVETQLVYSTDGINWKRTNNRKAFIPRVSGMMEVLGLPTVVGNNLYIYTIESQRRHTDYENANINGRFFSVWRYNISLDNLNTWKHVTNINLTLGIEGLMNSAGKHNKSDSITMVLRRSSYPYSIVDSASAKIDSATLTGSFNMKNVTTGNYYVVVRGKNIIETWSRTTASITQYQSVNLNFTTSISVAYGNNLILKNGKYCVHSGDLDYNGIIELSDVLTTFNDAGNFSTGIYLTDLNGDNIVDLQDMNIVNTNANKFIRIKRP